MGRRRNLLIAVAEKPRCLRYADTGAIEFRAAALKARIMTAGLAGRRPRASEAIGNSPVFATSDEVVDNVDIAK
jgi:hypothetical protein